MSENLTFYTVRYHQRGYPVRYIDPTTREVETFTGQDENGKGGGFDDPVEACGEFEACVGGASSCYLEPAQFQGKVRAFAKLKKQLETWNAMRPLSNDSDMDLSQAYNYLLAQGCAIVGDGDQYTITREGGTVRASLQEVIQIAEECKKQEQVAS